MLAKRKEDSAELIFWGGGLSFDSPSCNKAEYLLECSMGGSASPTINSAAFFSGGARGLVPKIHVATGKEYGARYY